MRRELFARGPAPESSALGQRRRRSQGGGAASRSLRRKASLAHTPQESPRNQELPPHPGSSLPFNAKTSAPWKALCFEASREPLSTSQLQLVTSQTAPLSEAPPAFTPLLQLSPIEFYTTRAKHLHFTNARHPTEKAIATLKRICSAATPHLHRPGFRTRERVHSSHPCGELHFGQCFDTVIVFSTYTQKIVARGATPPAKTTSQRRLVLNRWHGVSLGTPSLRAGRASRLKQFPVACLTLPKKNG